MNNHTKNQPAARRCEDCGGRLRKRWATLKDSGAVAVGWHCERCGARLETRSSGHGQKPSN